MKRVLTWFQQRLSKRPDNTGHHDAADAHRRDSRPLAADSVPPKDDHHEDYEPTVPNLRILDDSRKQDDEVPGYDPYDTVALRVPPKQT